MMIGYARTSTADQVAGLDAQERDLKAAGVEKLFSEHISGKDADRPQLAAAIEFCRDGDVFTCTKIDRLARSVGDLLGIIERLQRKRVAIRFLHDPIDTTTPSGELTLTILGAVAAFERRIMLERQAEGIAAAKAAGRYTGRQPTARRKSAQVVELHRAGIRPADIAKRLGMSRASAYRIVARVADAAD
jgi:DNA invertase Pin-like site-specific DNA recombinase